MPMHFFRKHQTLKLFLGNIGAGRVILWKEGRRADQTELISDTQDKTNNTLVSDAYLLSHSPFCECALPLEVCLPS